MAEPLGFSLCVSLVPRASQENNCSHQLNDDKHCLGVCVHVRVCVCVCVCVCAIAF